MLNFDSVGAITMIPANEKKRNNCKIMGHFSKTVANPEKSQAQSSKPQQTNFNQIDTTTTKSDDEQSVN